MNKPATKGGYTPHYCVNLVQDIDGISLWEGKTDENGYTDLGYTFYQEGELFGNYVNVKIGENGTKEEHLEVLKTNALESIARYKHD